MIVTQYCAVWADVRFLQIMLSQDLVANERQSARIQIWRALIEILLLKILQFKSTFGWALSNLII
jgi:hypothetical protein